MKKILTLAVTALLTLSACQKNEAVPREHDEATHATHQTDSLASHQEPTAHAALELNNGEKWETNTEMLPFIEKQEMQLRVFNPAEKSYLQLSKEMQAANEDLIKSCTMTGKSHDVLHVWLTDHMNALEALEKSTEKHQQEQAVASLITSIQTYHDYFQ